MVFWITARMKATKEQDDEKLMVIKLFASNYARDLLKSRMKKKMKKHYLLLLKPLDYF